MKKLVYLLTCLSLPLACLFILLSMLARASAAPPTAASLPIRLDYGVMETSSLAAPEARAKDASLALLAEAALLAPKSSTTLNPASASQEGDVAGEIISVVVAPTPVVAGESIKFDVTVRNIGDLPWPSDAQVFIEIRDANGLLQGTAASTLGRPVQAGETISAMADWPVPVDGLGNYTYAAKLSANSALLDTAPPNTLSVEPGGPKNARIVETVMVATSSSGSRRVALIPNASGAFSGTGPLWTNIPEIPGITFTNLPLGSVNAGFLAPYDTVVLMQVCNIATALSSSQKMDLINWVSNGGKLIIYDSDACSGGNTPDYSWFIYPFSTNNPGQQGARGGVLTVMEENTLSSADPASAYYINTADLVANTDAVGDSNVMITRDPHWYLDMQSTNVNNMTGYVHAYAEYDHGLIIYNGLDVDYTGNQWLRKIWVLELQQPWDPSGLPHGEPIVGQSSIQASPTSVPADGTSTISVTVTLRDANGNRLPGHEIQVISSRKNLDTFQPPTGTTDWNGRFVTRLRSYRSGSVVITAKDLTTGQPIAASASVRFTPVGGEPPPPPANENAVAITHVRPTYPLDGAFLQGVDLPNRIQVWIDWKDTTPGWVNFILNDQKFSQSASGNVSSYTFDMGHDLQAGHNSLCIIAYNAAGERSQAMTYAPYQIAQPEWLQALTNVIFFNPTILGGEVEGTFVREYELRFPANPIKVDAPFGFSNIGLEFDLGGKLSLPMDCTSPLKISGGGKAGAEFKMFDASFEIRGEVGGQSGRQAYCLFATPSGFWHVEAEGRKTVYSKPVLIVITYFNAAVGSTVDGIVTFLHIEHYVARLLGEVYVDGKVGLFAEGDLDFHLTSPHVTSDLTVGVKDFGVEGGVRGDWGPVKAKVYASGDGTIQFYSPEFSVNPSDFTFDRVVIGGEVGAEFEAWRLKRSAKGRIEWVYPEGSQLQGFALRDLTATDWQVVGRNPHEPYSLLRDIRTLQALAEMSPLTTVSTTLVSNVYTYTQPSLALRSDDQALLVWVHDDFSKPINQALELRYSRWNGSVWQADAAVTDDTFLDTTPNVIWDAYNNGLLVWERVNDSNVPITSTLDITFTRKLEIASAIYDAATDTWSAPTLLTTNNAADHSPRLARNNAGQVILVWRQNDAGYLAGDATNPDTLLYRTWDGANWSATQTALAGLARMQDVALAYDSGTATLAFSQVVSDTQAISDTVEIFTISWDSSTWNAPQQLTADDGWDNVQPQVAYTPLGDAIVVWRAGDQLRSHNLQTGAKASVPLPVNQAVANFTLAVAPDGRMAVVWLGQSGSTHDVYLSIYDVAHDLWGMPQRITNNSDREDYLSPALNSTGNLLMAYTNTGIVTQTQTMTVTGGAIVTFTLS